MSPFSHNIRRANSIRRSRALGAGLALTLMSAVVRADGAHQFVFTAFSDATGGAAVLAGRYQVALAELKDHRGAADRDPSAIDTNRCVAYSMSRQWQKARAACDAAVRAAGEQRELPTTAWWGWTPASNDDYAAVAYANRAVLRWLLKEEAAARQDLAKAQGFSPQAEFVARNLAALGVGSIQ